MQKLRRNIVLATLYKIREIVDDRQKRLLQWVWFYITLVSILELLGLSLVFPVISFISNSDWFIRFPRLSGWLGSLGLDAMEIKLAIIFGILLLFAAKNLLAVLIQRRIGNYAYRIGFNLNKRSFRYFMSQGLQYFKQTDTARITAYTVYLPSTFVAALMLPCFTFLTELLVLVLILTALAIYSLQLFLVLLLFLGPIFGLVYLMVRRKLNQLGRLRKDSFPQAYDALFQGVAGVQDIVLDGKELYFEQYFLHYQRAIMETDAKIYFFDAIPSKLLEIFAILGLCIILAFNLGTNPGNDWLLYVIGLFFAAAYRIMPSVNRMISGLMKMRTYQYSVDTLLDIKRKFPLLFKEEGPLPFEREITLDQLSFHYEKGGQAVLNQVKLQIRKGEWIGIKGGSGQGKSTLIAVLTRFLEETAGHIKVDGTNVDRSNRRTWRNMIGYVKQDVFLLNGTLEQNLAMRLDRDFDMARAREIIAALQLEELREELERSGQQTGEQGSRLSGGQRQRIALGRALFKNPQVLLLDEATNALDTETERLALEAIRKFAGKEVTVILVSHHSPAFAYCDRVFELKQGQLEEVSHV